MNAALHGLCSELEAVWNKQSEQHGQFVCQTKVPLTLTYLQPPHLLSVKWAVR